MTADVVQTETRKIVDLIADGRYSAVLQECAKSRLTEIDIEKVLREYGCTIVHAPPELSDYLDVVTINGCTNPTWSVRTPLWTLEEGRSDITIELTIVDKPGRPSIELDDIRVL